MTEIFISYSRDNKEVVNTLAADFAELGYNTWIDKELSGGQAWWTRILEQIRACDLFVISVSPHSLDSYACKLEWLYAHSLNKNILPVMVADGVSTNLLPKELSIIQYVDYRKQDKKAAFDLNKALSNLPGPWPLPDPLPDEPEVPVSYLGDLRTRIEARNKLGFEEQSAILLELKQGLSNQEDIDDIHELIRRFRKRDDLLAKIEREIDSLKTDSDSQTPDSKTENKKSGKPGTLSVPATITVESAIKEIGTVLQDTLSRKHNWALKGPACSININQQAGSITVQAESSSWSNFIFNSNLKSLAQQQWKIDYKQVGMAFGAFMLIIFSYGIALLFPKIRETIKTNRVKRTWVAVDDSQLTDIALDIVLAIKTIMPGCKTFTTEQKAA